MIIKDGHEVYPLRVKRIYRGDRLVYYRKSKLEAENLLELDLEALLLGRPSAPVEGETPAEFSVGGELEAKDSAATEFTQGPEFRVEGELYVKNVSPMSELPPLSVFFEAQAAAPASTAGEANQPLDIVLDGEAHAPAAAVLGLREDNEADQQAVPLDLVLAGEAAGPDAAPIEKDGQGVTPGFGPVFLVESEANTAAAAPIETEEGGAPLGYVTEFTLEGVPNAAQAVGLDFPGGLTFEIEGELWAQPGQWTAPVLLNHVLGITQVMEAVQEGSILKLY